MRVVCLGQGMIEKEGNVTVHIPPWVRSTGRPSKCLYSDWGSTICISVSISL